MVEKLKPHSDTLPTIFIDLNIAHQEDELDKFCGNCDHPLDPTLLNRSIPLYPFESTTLKVKIDGMNLLGYRCTNIDCRKKYFLISALQLFRDKILGHLLIEKDAALKEEISELWSGFDRK